MFATTRKPSMAHVLKKFSFEKLGETYKTHLEYSFTTERNNAHVAGEYFVAAELYSLGFSVALTIGNAKTK